MTPFESWLKDMTSACSRDLPTPDDPEHYFWGDVEDFTTLEQRICIALIQGRALENRQLAGMLAVQPPADVDPASALKISIACNSRSRMLEAMGMKLAKEWPPEWWSGERKVQ